MFCNSTVNLVPCVGIICLEKSASLDHNTSEKFHPSANDLVSSDWGGGGIRCPRRGLWAALVETAI